MLELVSARIPWRLHPISWYSRGRIKEWKKKFEGGKALILCNGPSLNKVNFDELAGYDIFTFGLNKINLLFSRTDFRPSAIVAVNLFVIEQNVDFYNNSEIPLFLDSIAREWVRFRDNVHFLHSRNKKRGFSRDCSIWVNQGGTVTYVAMQLAFYMGFKEVGLVGCDHYYSTQGPSHKVAVSPEKDPDHFDPNYFGGMEWQLPDLQGSEIHYKVAKDDFEGSGRRIVNCTEGGHLNIFERQPVRTFLES